jgi:hypothetical protein
MQLQRLDGNQQIQITDESTNTVQKYFKIPWTSPTFRSERLPKRDRKNIHDLAGFLGEHCMDAYVDFSDNQRIEVLAFAKSPELYMMANGYLHTKINNVNPDRTLKIGNYIKGKGGEIKMQKNGPPKIRGGKFDVRLLPYKKFPNNNPGFYSGLRLTPRNLFKGRTIDLVIIPEDFFKSHKEEAERKRIWQEWLEKGSDVYCIY